MMCRVSQLYLHGVRFTLKTRIATAIGDLNISEYHHPVLGRRMVAADLLEPKEPTRLLNELCDVRIQLMGKDGFMLQGTEAVCVRGKATEFRQEWWCVPIPQENEPVVSKG